MKKTVLFSILLSLSFGISGFSQDLVSIHDIQYTTNPSGVSEYNGQSVMTDGKILAKVTDGSSIGYFIQNGTGSWNGLFVWDQSGVSGGFPLDVNSVWRFTGTVNEVNGLTVLSNLSEFNENGSVTTPNYQVVDIADIGEEYESVLIRIENAECINAGSGEFIIKSNGSQETLKVVDYIYNPNLINGNDYTITGMLYFINNEFVLCPRNSYDVEEIVAVNSIKKQIFTVYPNPNKGDFTISFKDAGNFEISLYDVLGNTIYFNKLENKNMLNINLKDVLSTGYYMLRIKDQNGDEITRKLLIQ